MLQGYRGRGHGLTLLFAERGYSSMLEKLAGIIGDVTIADPQPYLPQNPDFGEEITVIYAMMKFR